MSALIDVIDRLSGIEAGSALAQLRLQRPDARENAQKSFVALFWPADSSDVSVVERFAVATFVAGLHREAIVTDFYATELAGQGEGAVLVKAITAEAERGATEGPYGRFPSGPLSREDRQGPAYAVVDEVRPVLGQRLSAALVHAHRLVFHPRDAGADALQALLDAGWSATGVVTLSQLVTFLTFQLRMVAGLRVLKAA